MKKVKFLICTCILFWSLSALAQQVTYRKETIYLDGKPYAYLFKEGSSWAKNFSLQNLKNEELMKAKAIVKEIGDGYDYVYYELSFKGVKAKAEMEDEKDLPRRLAYEIGNMNVVKGDELDPEGVQKFLEKYPPRISQRFQKPGHQGAKPVAKEEPKTDVVQESAQPVSTQKIEEVKPELPAITTPTAVSIVQEPLKDKNISAPVSTSSQATVLPSGNIAVMTTLKFSGNRIMRGKKQVGVFKVSEKVVNNKLKKTYIFLNLENQKVAEGSFDDPKSTTCRMFTVKDKMTYNLPVRNDENSLKVLSSWLIQNKYF
ncbi:hypothetical protein [Adhaeribacter soli]|uniref:DUF4468 domain-containing protein n=1 Tax=Adhaeribacter soli TaxID=2607655 RepID=A0A5N1J5D3_9BACT|nr:hypothetical protein [Adhaeribacter soli]KAA9346116.1 hypothetical protein F0P94_03270 [Adhaeribacter soli]